MEEFGGRGVVRVGDDAARNLRGGWQPAAYEEPGDNRFGEMNSAASFFWLYQKTPEPSGVCRSVLCSAPQRPLPRLKLKLYRHRKGVLDCAEVSLDVADVVAKRINVSLKAVESFVHGIESLINTSKTFRDHPSKLVVGNLFYHRILDYQVG